MCDFDEYNSSMLNLLNLSNIHLCDEFWLWIQDLCHDSLKEKFFENITKRSGPCVESPDLLLSHRQRNEKTVRTDRQKVRTSGFFYMTVRTFMKRSGPLEFYESPDHRTKVRTPSPLTGQQKWSFHKKSGPFEEKLAVGKYLMHYTKWWFCSNGYN